MKAEERKHLKENELAERLGKLWQYLASGSTTNTIIWGLILVGLALTIGWRYYSSHSFRTSSAEWSAVERANSAAELEQIIKDNPGKVVARVAKVHLTRYQMDDALARVAGPSSEDRIKAADALTAVYTRYSEIAKEFSDQPELVQEALMGVAKADEVLAAIPKVDSPKEPRETLDAAQEAYEELAKRYPESYFGKQAKKRAEEIKDHKLQIRGFYDSLMEAHGVPPPLPPLPPIPPTPPTAAPNPALPDLPKAVDPKMVPPPNPPPAEKPATPAPVQPTPPKDGPTGDKPAEAPKEPKPKAP
jgi:hypothetical protein